MPGHGTRAGIVERHKADPGGDRWAEDPKDRWINGKTLLTGPAHPATPGRSTWDIQAQRLPIINTPGFAGSTIKCGTERLWAPEFTGNGARLNAMRLAPDGRTNAGCPTAGPTIDPNAEDGFVNEALGLPIYQKQDAFIEQIAPGERGWRFSWDWRKAPGESLARLHAFITHILNTDMAKSQGVEKVVLYGHSVDRRRGGFAAPELPGRVRRGGCVDPASLYAGYSTHPPFRRLARRHRDAPGAISALGASWPRTARASAGVAYLPRITSQIRHTPVHAHVGPGGTAGTRTTHTQPQRRSSPTATLTQRDSSLICAARTCQTTRVAAGAHQMRAAGDCNRGAPTKRPAAVATRRAG